MFYWFLYFNYYNFFFVIVLLLLLLLVFCSNMDFSASSIYSLFLFFIPYFLYFDIFLNCIHSVGLLNGEMKFLNSLIIYFCFKKINKIKCKTRNRREFKKMGKKDVVMRTPFRFIHSFNLNEDHLEAFNEKKMKW